MIKLLDEGRIPFERVGTHRRILLRDLLVYRERRRAEQYAALEATAVDIDDEQDLDTALERTPRRRRPRCRRCRHSAAQAGMACPGS